VKQLVAFICIILTNLYALDLYQLQQQVQQEDVKSLKIDKQRKAKFLADVKKAKAKLAAVKNELNKQKKLTGQLKNTFKILNKQIQSYTKQLKNKAGDLNNLFAVSKQEAKDLDSLLKDSMVSTQFPEREKLLKFAYSNNNPTITDLYNLYKIYFSEIVESGKNVSYKSRILTKSGENKNDIVTRIGLFTAFNNNGYLYYDPSIGRFIELQKQPQDKYLNFIQYYEKHFGIVPALIDPTRGILFSMLKEYPSLEERIKQGGIIGYIIIALGILAVLIAIYKYILLLVMEINIKKQMKSDEIKINNPLGRILKAFQKYKSKDIEVIQNKLDSILMKEVPSIVSKLSVIKLIAAVAPLLGLLGTVTGMIETFQSITLFGTGNPKLMAGGISQALVTTVLGLVVAIPVLFIYNILYAKAKTIIEVLTQQSAAIIAEHLELLEKENKCSNI
jgi:biopolymer transport protein ExbB